MDIMKILLVGVLFWSVFMLTWQLGQVMLQAIEHRRR
jgi:hypothetical protein